MDSLPSVFHYFGQKYTSGIAVTLETTIYATCVLLALLSLEYFLRSQHHLYDIPSPPGASWIWGHEREVWETSAGIAYANWMHQLQTNIFKIKGALRKKDILVVADPLAITYIMQKRIYDYPHSEVVRPRIARLLGKSLGWVEGESEHRRMRHLVGPALSAEAIKQGAYKVFAASETLELHLEKEIIINDGAVIISVCDWVNQATIDVIGRFGFDHNFEGGKSEDALNILNSWRQMAIMGISERGFLALMMLRRFPLLNYLPLKALKAQGDVRLNIHSGVAKELLRRSQGASTDGNDLLSRLFSAHSSDKISTDELMDHISMFIMAGSETTSQTLGYALWELAKNPSIQENLRKEIMSMPGTLAYDDIQSTSKLPYLDAVTRETLRFHPAAPYMERVSLKSDVLPLRHPLTTTSGRIIGELPIEKGQTIIFPIHAIGRQDSVWGDGGSYRPERWLETLPAADALPTGWSHLLAFSDGPRTCTGYRLAIFQFKVILAGLIRKFRFHDTGAVIKNKVTSSMQPITVGEEHISPRLPVKVTLV
ncbi:hypothetical protein D9757_012335 [Collybiopsis confluens]|uniref:Cytochrome P450 n=1 Tax=Collybiopsis confluens TaxID=2823264 RepID=A0A8H5D7I7_9AGAR|nr:hypothetical protein D9757_012335 [Collybiopsis confluens]